MISDVFYLDAIFSAIRVAGEHITSAEDAVTNVEEAAGWRWQLPLLATAEDARIAAWAKLLAAEDALSSLGPSGKLPTLLDELPARLAKLRERLTALEDRLSRAALVTAARPLGQA
jgi:hypothetical protein